MTNLVRLNPPAITLASFVFLFLASCVTPDAALDKEAALDNARTVDDFARAKQPDAAAQSSAPTSALSYDELKDVPKMLMQRDRATAPQKKLALELLADGKTLATKEDQVGLRSQRSGLSKVFCSSAAEYPTVDALIGCAESLALANMSFDAKLQSFGEAAAIYRTVPAFGNAISDPLSIQQQEKIEAKVACLNAFAWQPNLEKPGCQLVREALRQN